MCTRLMITFKDDKVMQMLVRGIELDNINNRLICRCTDGKVYYIMLDEIRMYATSIVY